MGSFEESENSKDFLLLLFGESNLFSFPLPRRRAFILMTFLVRAGHAKLPLIMNMVSSPPPPPLLGVTCKVHFNRPRLSLWLATHSLRMKMRQASQPPLHDILAENLSGKKTRADEAESCSKSLTFSSVRLCKVASLVRLIKLAAELTLPDNVVGGTKGRGVPWSSLQQRKLCPPLPLVHIFIAVQCAIWSVDNEGNKLLRFGPLFA